VIDYRTTDFRQGGVKYDLILDAVGKSLEDGGIDKKSCMPVLNGRAAQYFDVGMMTEVSREKLETLNVIVDEGRLTTLMDRVYPVEQFREAHDHAYSGHKRGNVVIRWKHA